MKRTMKTIKKSMKTLNRSMKTFKKPIKTINSSISTLKRSMKSERDRPRMKTLKNFKKLRKIRLYDRDKKENVVLKPRTFK